VSDLRNADSVYRAGQVEAQNGRSELVFYGDVVSRPVSSAEYRSFGVRKLPG
jgi:hypothetical protein